MMPRTVALTGATGFIGGVLARQLLAETWQVRALVRPQSRHKPLPAGVQCVIGALEDPASMRELAQGADAIIHCAGAVRGATALGFYVTNAAATKTLAAIAAAQHPAPRFLLISSLAAREPGLSPYAGSKREAESALAEVAGAMRWAALRAPAVYGPGDRELLPLFQWMARGIAPVWGARDARFSLIYVTDLARGAVRWLDCEAPTGVISELHDGHPDGYTIDDIIDSAARVFERRISRLRVPAPMLDLVARANLMLGRIVGYAPMLTPWKLRELRYPRWVCDNAAFTAATGWEPMTSLEDGLRRTMVPNVDARRGS